MEDTSSLSSYFPTKRAGKLCYFTSGRSFDLPLRDLLNECHSGFKKEPNCETATYNWYSSCNQRSVVAAVRQGLSYLLFVTKYHGQLREYHGRYFVTGWFEIGSVGTVAGRTFIKAKTMVFTDIENAYEITPERWRMICPGTKCGQLTNLRWATQVISGDLLEKICEQLYPNNKITEYIQQVEEIKRSLFR